MDLKPALIALQNLSRALKAIESPKRPLNDYQLVEALLKASAAAGEINLEDLKRALAAEGKTVSDRIAISLEQRRENLLNAAKVSGIPNKRFGDYDRIGPLKISYKGKKVRVEIGSEALAEFGEADGQKVFEKSQEALKALDDEPFERENFFKAMNDAMRLAKEHGRADRQEWVPIRSVYTYFILLRHLYIDEFTKKPETNKFRKYTRAQFVYDLARFGGKGWSVGNETLRSRTPNMATVAAGKTMIIPDLKSVEAFGDQISVMRIEKLGG
jgi:hypothetical protein